MLSHSISLSLCGPPFSTYKVQTPLNECVHISQLTRLETPEWAIGFRVLGGGGGIGIFGHSTRDAVSVPQHSRNRGQTKAIDFVLMTSCCRHTQQLSKGLGYLGVSKPFPPFTLFHRKKTPNAPLKTHISPLSGQYTDKRTQWHAYSHDICVGVWQLTFVKRLTKFVICRTCFIPHHSASFHFGAFHFACLMSCPLSKSVGSRESRLLLCKSLDKLSPPWAAMSDSCWINRGIRKGKLRWENRAVDWVRGFWGSRGDPGSGWWQMHVLTKRTDGGLAAWEFWFIVQCA